MQGNARYSRASLTFFENGRFLIYDPHCTVWDLMYSRAEAFSECGLPGEKLKCPSGQKSYVCPRTSSQRVRPSRRKVEVPFRTKIVRTGEEKKLHLRVLPELNTHWQCNADTIGSEHLLLRCHGIRNPNPKPNLQTPIPNPKLNSTTCETKVLDKASRPQAMSQPRSSAYDQHVNRSRWVPSFFGPLVLGQWAK